LKPPRAITEDAMGFARGRTANPDLSIIIPVQDEEGNLPELIRRLTATMTCMAVSYEIIFVTDVNRDNTLGILREHNREDPRIKTVKLSNCLGQHLAAVAGLEACSGNAAVLMDGDLQDCPEDVPKLYARMSQGFDVVYATKKRKNESRIRNMLTRIFLGTLNGLSDHKIEHNTCMFRILSRRVIEQLKDFREKDVSLTGIVSLIGFPQDHVEVASGKRLAGESKYGLMRQINFAISFLLSFTTRPLRLISIFGLLVSSLSFLYFVVVLVQTLVFKTPVTGWPTIVLLILFLGGVQLMALGIVGEYIARIFLEAKNRPRYIVEERIGTLR
jgi:glycosyltransferase involved in cell wall biosynthesis